MTRYLTVEDLLFLTARLGVGPVRDLGLLDSAAHRPATNLSGFEPYPDVASKAAALLHSVVRTHPLVDGNKRLAWAAALVFLRVNGMVVEMSDDEAFELVMAAAAGDLEVDAIAQRLRLTIA